ncbi:HalOD1 output domain-containing protein [Natrinema salaciae]|uniref:Halobacterial output domain-containing protein n=1 Tax=Natrinema salaciae TaxID=1186196 RepID=A0A1H9CFT4_9EURY|nr:HalOD1 output domain-containing protein [Natrinema salaciae]SEP99877.1 hypothetical protein SAMN04489841_1037 [Natrinema salaciae]
MDDPLYTSISTVESDDSDELIEAIVEQIADAEGVSPLELVPLATVIDPEALCALCRRGASERIVKFRYQGHRVRVSSGDQVTVAVGDG